MTKYRYFLGFGILLCSLSTLAFKGTGAGNLKDAPMNLGGVKEATDTNGASKAVDTASMMEPQAAVPQPWENGYKPQGLGKDIQIFKNSSECSKHYIGKADGPYGDRAKLLMKDIMASPLAHKFLVDELPGMDASCPGYNSWGQYKNENLRNNLRLNFWVNVFSRIAYYKSDCVVQEKKVCDSGLCGGDFGVPEEYTARSWRLPRFFRGGGDWERKRKIGCRADHRRTKEAWWAENHQNSTGCAVEIMGGMLCGMYEKNEERCTATTSPFLGEGYWKTLNAGERSEAQKTQDAKDHQRGDIKPIIPIREEVKFFPVCKVGLK